MTDLVKIITKENSHKSWNNNSSNAYILSNVASFILCATITETWETGVWCLRENKDNIHVSFILFNAWLMSQFMINFFVLISVLAYCPKCYTWVHIILTHHTLFEILLTSHARVHFGMVNFQLLINIS